jgi:hypothetical protein
MEYTDKLVQHIQDVISVDLLNYVYSRMCLLRIPLKIADYYLYNLIEYIVQNFIEDNELSQEWFEENFFDVDDLFVKCLD